MIRCIEFPTSRGVARRRSSGRAIDTPRAARVGPRASAEVPRHETRRATFTQRLAHVALRSGAAARRKYVQRRNCNGNPRGEPVGASEAECVGDARCSP